MWGELVFCHFAAEEDHVHACGEAAFYPCCCRGMMVTSIKR